ncbi:MAG: homoserine kinase [Opitutaceae bacterium]|nr:homoserine kinase [Opitutaceae bacterium]
MRAPDSVTVRVPGSTSNCGSGFDTLGLALRIYNRLTVTRQAGAGAPVPATAGDAAVRPLVEAAAEMFFQKTGRTPFSFSYRVAGDVPPARGLGSSATVRAGLLAGLNALAGTGLSSRLLIELVTALEGHPDNATASVLGGFCVARTSPVNGAYLDCVRVTVPAELAFVVVSPHVEIRTKESRGTLPRTVPFFDAVKSINATAFLVAALATRDFGKLRHAVADFMHEPYRLPGIPGGRQAIDAGIAAGALTGWLSGSGSSVLCVCERPAAASVRPAMEAALKEAGAGCNGSWVLVADDEGLMLE